MDTRWVSDVDYAEAHYGPSEAEVQLKLEDDARMLRWNAFIEATREYAREFDWCGVFIELARVHADGTTRADAFAYGDAMHDYAQSDGWACVLRAIARAMEVEAIERREIEARR